MARKLDKSIQKAGLGSWFKRLCSSPKGSSEIAHSEDPGDLNPSGFSPLFYFPYNHDGFFITLYCIAVFFSTIVLAAQATTDQTAWQIAALGAIVVNFFLFFRFVWGRFEKDLRFSACLLIFVFPSAFLIASIMGLYSFH